MSVSSPLGSVDPTALSVSSYDDTYPTPPTMPADGQSATPEPSNKKKRKAWGQPVPEIKAILPPRKRAKTAEEKEQRKNERILRNRRAADKSRQRQKAAVAELEAKQGRMEQENAILRELVSRYESRFGVQNDFPIQQFSISNMSDVASAPSPLDLNNVHGDTPATSMSYETPAPEPQEPTLVQDDSTTSVKHESPALAPTLNLIDDHSKADQSTQVASYDSSSEVSVSTGHLGAQAISHSIQPSLQSWSQSAPTNDPGFDDLSSIFNFNALANLQSVPDFGTAIGDEFDGTDFLVHSEHLSHNSFFDFDAFDTDQTSSLPHETSEPTSRMQPTHGAPITGSDRQGFAASS